MPEVLSKIPAILLAAYWAWIIVHHVVFGTDNRPMQVIGVFLLVGVAWSLILRLTGKLPTATFDLPRRARHVVKPGGKWETAPLAEIDKSTTGQLLAGRLRRNPEIHVSTTPSGPSDPASEAARQDKLWDREIDG